jgi:RecA/RadA recombinase
MASLIDRLKKSSKIDNVQVFSKSTMCLPKDFIQTKIPLLNLALSGDIDGGLTSGLTIIAGPSRHYKSNYGLSMVSAFQKKYPEGVVIFYDSEFGSTEDYFKANDVDPERVLHCPITNIEELKFDIMNQIDNFEKNDKIMFFIDSIGNLASKKEVEDALKENAAADMTRAKQFKSLFRMITPHLTLKDIPMVAINHIYMTQEMFSKPVVSGGTGIMLSANTVLIIGRSQNKKGTELEGYTFTINIEKSRFVKEKSKFQIEVSFDEGIVKYSGLLDDAVEGGYVDKPKVGWYSRPCVPDDKNYREKDTKTEEFWTPIFANTDFKQYLSKKYKLSADFLPSLENDEIVDEDDI